MGNQKLPDFLWNIKTIISKKKNYVIYVCIQMHLLYFIANVVFCIIFIEKNVVYTYYTKLNFIIATILV